MTEHTEVQRDPALVGTGYSIVINVSSGVSCLPESFIDGRQLALDDLSHAVHVFTAVDLDAARDPAVRVRHVLHGLQIRVVDRDHRAVALYLGHANTDVLDDSEDISDLDEIPDVHHVLKYQEHSRQYIGNSVLSSERYYKSYDTCAFQYGAGLHPEY